MSTTASSLSSMNTCVKPKPVVPTRPKPVKSPEVNGVPAVFHVV